MIDRMGVKNAATQRCMLIQSSRMASSSFPCIDRAGGECRRKARRRRPGCPSAGGFPAAVRHVAGAGIPASRPRRSIQCVHAPGSHTAPASSQGAPPRTCPLPGVGTGRARCRARPRSLSTPRRHPSEPAGLLRPLAHPGKDGPRPFRQLVANCLRLCHVALPSYGWGGYFFSIPRRIRFVMNSA